MVPMADDAARVATIPILDGYIATSANTEKADFLGTMLGSKRASKWNPIRRTVQIS
jgi:hypothetical protein